MDTQADVISAAIESLDVQVPWGGARLVGVEDSDVPLLEPLFKALSEHDGLEGALQRLTHEVFVYGNVAVFVSDAVTKVWRPDWRQSQEHVDAALTGSVLEARRPPIGRNGYGTPAIEQGAEAFKRRWAGQAGHMAALQNFINDPVGDVPLGAKQDQAATTAVLNAIGFDAFMGSDIPRYRHGRELRAEMRQLFEDELLRPYATLKGVRGTPSVVLP